MDELTEMPESMLDKVSKYYRRMVNHIGRKLTGNKSATYMDADRARIEMQNMGSNNLHQALLDGYEEHAGAPMLGGGDDDEKLAEVPESSARRGPEEQVPEPEDTPVDPEYRQPALSRTE